MTTSNLAEAKKELACALRAAAHFGFSEGVCNHFSLAVPGRPGEFLINPQGFHWSELTPEDLVVIDAEGRKVAGKHEVEPTAFFIHGCIHRIAPDAACVLHTHMPFATALTMVEGGKLEMASQNALRFFDQVAYDERYNGLVLDDREGERIARKMVDASVLFLANHGVIVRGPNVAYAFDDLYYLERACMHQVLAMGTGKPLKLIPESVAMRTAAQIGGERQQSTLHLQALRRMFGFT
ncbi:MAG TPA: aldolase [Burkholderiaceae bacterium]|jgi:ribulose-5-phosphate 4-epimerase/fuculose-1-phosphate aldolase|nr:aldolase [Burkholderiaceae bacterium]